MPLPANTTAPVKSHNAESAGEEPRTHHALLLVIAAAIAILHLATNSRYGFHRDELQFLSDARHLDWGFVSYPPYDAFPGAHWPQPLWPFARGSAPVLGDRAGSGHLCERTDGPRSRRRAPGPGHRGIGGRTVAAAAL